MDAAPSSEASPGSWFVFDVARATAALLVLLSHARDLTLTDAADQPALSLPGRVFYALSGLGHQAVIVFFVVSGFLVTRSMIRLAAQNQWSLRVFAAARLTRLWIVLVPCLAIGAVFDRIGLAVSGHAADAAGYGILAVTVPVSPPALDPLTFIGNILFLQTIAVRSYGSNGALWSLANEAWYYGMAALVFGVWRLRKTPMAAAGHVAVLVLIIVLLPRSILVLAPVWACGACLALIRSGQVPPPRFQAGLSIAVFAAVLAMARARLGHHSIALDYMLGGATAWLLWCHLGLVGASSRWTRAAQLMSHASYSLYLSHLPFLALVTACAFGQNRLHFGLLGLVRVAAEVILALGFATLVWWCFEQRTPAVRALVSAHIKTPGPGKLDFGATPEHKGAR